MRKTIYKSKYIQSCFQRHKGPLGCQIPWEVSELYLITLPFSEISLIIILITWIWQVNCGTLWYFPWVSEALQIHCIIGKACCRPTHRFNTSAAQHMLQQFSLLYFPLFSCWSFSSSFKGTGPWHTTSLQESISSFTECTLKWGILLLPSHLSQKHKAIFLWVWFHPFWKSPCTLPVLRELCCEEGHS